MGHYNGYSRLIKGLDKISAGRRRSGKIGWTKVFFVYLVGFVFLAYTK
jgi:hypothetical protein